MLEIILVLCLVPLVPLFFYHPAIYKRLKVKANTIASTISDSMDDPIEESKYDIEQAEKELLEYKQSAASLLAQNIKLKGDNNINSSDVEKYTRLAESAAERGNENDARTFLERRNLSQKKLEELTNIIRDNESLLEKIRSNIEVHQNRLSLAKNKSEQLKSRLTNAELRDKMSSLSLSDSGLANLDKLEKRVLEKEAITDARIQLSDTSIEAKYTSSKVEEELSDLMSRFKKV